MTPVRRIVLVAAVFGALVTGAIGHAHGPKTREYVGHFDPLTFGACVEEDAPANIGKVCFPLNSSVDNYVDVSGNDIVLGKPGMFFVFRDPSGNCPGKPDDPTAVCPNEGFICGSVANLPVPNAAVRLDVFALGTLGTAYCTGIIGGDTVGASTTGTISAHFTDSISGT